MRKKSSWKDRIDPAFDKLIKYYLQFLNQTGLPSTSGWLLLEDEALKLWEDKDMPGWIKRYEKEMTAEKKTIIKWKTQKTMPEKERNKARRDFQKWLFHELKDLPEDSQTYYKKKFAPFYSEEKLEDLFNNKSIKDLKEIYTDFFTNSFLLSLHSSAVQMKNEFDNRPEKEMRKKYIKPSIILDILMGGYNSIAALVFEKSVAELIKEARNGDPEAFFKLLQIDRTVIECEWAQKMIRKSQLTGDETFFKRMAKSITTSPLENDKEYTTLRIVLLVFWRFGLSTLENDELIELLEECGLKIHDDSESFRRFVNRLIDSETKRNPIPISFNTPPHL